MSGTELVACGTYTATTVIDGQTLASTGSANAFFLRMEQSFTALASSVMDCTTCYGGQIECADDGHFVARVNASGLMYFSDSTMWGNSGNVLLKLGAGFEPLDQMQISFGSENYGCRFRIDHENNVIRHEWFNWTSGGMGNSLTKTDPDFDFTWYSSYLGEPLENITSWMGFDIDSQNNIYFAGYNNPYMTSIVHRLTGKLNKWGVLQWMQSDSTNGAASTAIKILGEDDFLLAGYAPDSSRLGPFHYSGNRNFIAHFGGTSIGIDETDLNDGFAAYPNPAENEFTVYSENKSELQIFNAAGQIVKSIQLNEGNNAVKEDLAAGLYLLVLRSEKGLSRQRLVVQ